MQGSSSRTQDTAVVMGAWVWTTVPASYRRWTPRCSSISDVGPIPGDDAPVEVDHGDLIGGDLAEDGTGGAHRHQVTRTQAHIPCRADEQTFGGQPSAGRRDIGPLAVQHGHGHGA